MEIYADIQDPIVISQFEIVGDYIYQLHQQDIQMAELVRKIASNMNDMMDMINVLTGVVYNLQERIEVMDQEK